MTDPMSPADVPQQLVDAATFAFAARSVATGNDTDFVAYVRAQLAAVLPLHEQQVRERVAAEQDVTLDGLIDAAHRRRPGFDEDVRAVADACAEFGNDEGSREIRQLYARFADRIAVLEQRDTTPTPKDGS